MADENIRCFLVLPKNCDNKENAPEMMIQAYDACRQLIKDIIWIKEEELSKKTFTKFDYLVFNDFEQRDFTQFIAQKCAVLEPLALIVCLMENKPIPKFTWEIKNVAMYGCEISSSSLSKCEKVAIQKKVQLMGGLYSASFTEELTHLICMSTKSEKYMLAAQRGVKLMMPKWIDYLFEASQSKNINADDSKVLEKFQCPPLFNLVICTTGINSKDLGKLSELVAANGGQFVQALSLSKTDILICGGSLADSKKYNAAKKCPNISCVTIDWVYDSIKKGYALKHEDYAVKINATTSTPEKSSENINPNYSAVSAIGNSISILQNITINATNMSTVQPINNNHNRKRKSQEILENLDIKKVKNAGNFLEGCAIFVVGFSQSAREKLNKIINISGATRYDTMSNRITHVIVGDQNDSAINEINSMNVNCLMVNLQWLIDSVENKRPVEEENYLINPTIKDSTITTSNTDSASLSKTVLSLLGDHKDSSDQQTRDSLTINNDDEEDTLAKILRNQYSTVDNPKSNTSSEPPMNIIVQNNSVSNNKEHESIQSEEESAVVIPGLVESFKIFLDPDFDDNEEMIASILDINGTIVKNSKDICDYAVFQISDKQLIDLPQCKEIVNTLWLQECLEKQKLIKDIKYYHRRVELTDDLNPLVNLVITLSGITGKEREFLHHIIELLGGTSQEMLSKVAHLDKNLLASTHLICEEPSGRKYDAAIKWKLHVTTKEWLLECLKKGTKVVEKNFSFAFAAQISRNQIFNSTSVETPQKVPAAQNEDVVKSTAKIYAATLPDTPKNHINNFKAKNRISQDSPSTPVNKIIANAIENNVMPNRPISTTNDIKTPDTPLGAFLCPNPSPGLRKEMQRYINQLPEFVPPRKSESTPLSEIKRRLWMKLFGSDNNQTDIPNSQEFNEAVKNATANTKPGKCLNFDSSDEEITINDENNLQDVAIQQKLEELSKRVMSGENVKSSRRSTIVPEESTIIPGSVKKSNDIQTQVCTVGWDYSEENKLQHNNFANNKRFMLSGFSIEHRKKLAEMLKKLGATVLDNTVNYESSATHLICMKPGKNEKSLASMAAGKFILHYSYVEKSAETGHFLDEEDFEFGNPKTRSKEFYSDTFSCIYFWRKEITRRGYGAFNDMRAIIIAEKRDSLVKVIEAGGGVVINAEPPFDHDSIEATHCLTELLRIKNPSDYVPLAKKGIKCLNTIYINHFLWSSGAPRDDEIIPALVKYYK